jgi:hypothetical protein
VREGVLRVLGSISAPAYVRNNRMDVLAANRLGRALFADVYAEGAVGFNLARYLFLDPRSRDFYTHWDLVALRTEAGRNPYDRGLTDLVGELSTRSEQFRTWWAAHNRRTPRRLRTCPELPRQLERAGTPREPARARDHRGDEVTMEQNAPAAQVWVSGLCLGTMSIRARVASTAGTSRLLTTARSSAT